MKPFVQKCFADFLFFLHEKSGHRVSDIRPWISKKGFQIGTFFKKSRSWNRLSFILIDISFNIASAKLNLQSIVSNFSISKSNFF